MLSHMLHSTALFAALFIGTAVLPSSLRAQHGADSVSIAAQRLLPGPTAANTSGWRVAPAGFSRLALPDALTLSQSRQRANVGVGPNLALMGTGGAAVVIGLLVGGNSGTAIAVGGGTLGLVGLYRFLR